MGRGAAGDFDGDGMKKRRGADGWTVGRGEGVFYAVGGFIRRGGRCCYVSAEVLFLVLYNVGPFCGFTQK